MEPEFRYRPTQSILTKIDVRKKYEFPSQYDPILGLGAPRSPSTTRTRRTMIRSGGWCRSKLEELEIADPSRRAALSRLSCQLKSWGGIVIDSAGTTFPKRTGRRGSLVGHGLLLSRDPASTREHALAPRSDQSCSYRPASRFVARRCAS